MLSVILWVLAGYQAVALVGGYPRLSTLSHRWPWSLVLYGYMALVVLHFLKEAAGDRNS